MSEWEHQAELLAKIQKDWVQKLNKVGILLTNEVKKELGLVYPPASEAGEPPHLRTGELRRSIAWEVDETDLKVRVGTNKNYAGFLERGTTLMDARPFLKPVAEANAGVVKQIMQKPLS